MTVTVVTTCTASNHPSRNPQKVVVTVNTGGWGGGGGGGGARNSNNANGTGNFNTEFKIVTFLLQGAGVVGCA